MTVIVVVVVIMMMIIIVVIAKAAVIQQIIDDRRSGGWVDIWREEMIQLGPVQIIRRHLLPLHCGPIFFELPQKHCDTQALSPAELERNEVRESTSDQQREGTVMKVSYAARNEEQKFQLKFARRLILKLSSKNQPLVGGEHRRI